MRTLIALLVAIAMVATTTFVLADTEVVRPGDTFSSIVSRYCGPKIRAANPGLRVDAMQIGDNIEIPFVPKSVAEERDSLKAQLDALRATLAIATKAKEQAQNDTRDAQVERDELREEKASLVFHNHALWISAMVSVTCGIIFVLLLFLARSKTKGDEAKIANLTTELQELKAKFDDIGKMCRELVMKAHAGKLEKGMTFEDGWQRLVESIKAKMAAQGTVAQLPRPTRATRK